MPPRLVLLSDHGAHGQRLARVMAARGVPIAAVVVTSVLVPPQAPNWSEKAKFLAVKARRELAFWLRHRQIYAPLGTQVVPGGTVNSPRTFQALRSVAPDFILVATTKLLPQSAIDAARIGAINVHPAILPYVRGSGVPAHSLRLGVPLGATLHFIDAGIDTGKLIERRLLPVAQQSSTLQQLSVALDELGANMMADVALQIAQTGEAPLSTAQTARFPLHKWQNAEGLRAANELAKSGRARELFEAYQAATDGPPHYRLASDWMPDAWETA